MGEWNKNWVLSNDLIKVELPPWKIWKADFSSVSPSSERIEKLWGAVVLYGSVEEELPLVEIWWHEFYDKLAEWGAFIDPVWRECTQLKDEWSLEDFFGFLCSCGVRNGPQIVILWWEWLGRLKWRVTGLGAFVSFLSTSRRCSRNRSDNLLPALPM